jgi:hypothetical protein
MTSVSLMLEPLILAFDDTKMCWEIEFTYVVGVPHHKNGA